MNLHLKYANVIDTTIYFEIKRYLNEMAKYFDKLQKIDDKEFIQWFKNKS